VRLLLLALPLVLAAAPALAQMPQGWTRAVAPFAVQSEAGAPVEAPFAGGSMAPRPQWADVDGDGDLDLLVQTYADRLTLWERTGPAVTDLAWQTDDWHGLRVGQWARAADLDGDGDLDLLAEEPISGVRFYARQGDAFADPVGPLLDARSGAPLAADRQNVPALADLTCDGIADLLQAQVDGTLTVYEGLGPDAGGVPQFALLRAEWPGVLVIGDPKAAPNPFGFGPSPADPEPRHGASALDAADVDGDGDTDIVWGDFFSPGLYLLENDGTCPLPGLSIATTAYPTTGLRTAGYNAPALADATGDGLLDLTIGVVGGAFGSAPVRNLLVLEGLGDGRFGPPLALAAGLDVGSQSAPAWGDLDGDGDLDLVVGTGEGTLHAWENVGGSSPRLKPVRLAGVGVEGYSLVPALGDLDGDGRADLLVGTFGGDVLGWRQVGPFAFEPMRVGPEGSAQPLTRLPRGNAAAPALSDVDGDGDLDLVVGEASGDLNLILNGGLPDDPAAWQVASERLIERIGGGARVSAHAGADGRTVLVVGARTGAMGAFRQTEGLTFEPFEVPLPPGPLPPDAAPALADLDGDGVPDLTLGTAAGGLWFFHGER
jgi:hypothetical protein